ncbi:ZIP family metal transporter [Congregibacter brevis]|uniref:ZIP family metal transporter n=1 Tax=Congregibacter brevis TaxID=3081201 RepID=A0ABZ0IBB6_9GAMM|nr:ZIP family metal transporter [Congregibacter sp. IMCC45268]
MSPMLLLVAYGTALIVFSLAGGALTQRVVMTHTRTQLAMSLVSGLMLGVAFFHLLPHAVLTLGIDHGLTTVMSWTMLGLIVMLLMLRMLHFHQPEFPTEAQASCDHDQEHDHAHTHSLATDESPKPIVPPGVSWKGVLTGLTFHTFIDGIALGAALLSASHGHEQQLVGFGVFLAILLHKPLDAMSIVGLMKASDTTASAQSKANLLFAFVCPLGAVLFYFYAAHLGTSAEVVIASALAFSAGAFVCIALSDLLPEVQFHSHDRVKLTAVFLLGILLAYGMANSTPDHTHTLPTALSSGR